MNLQHKKAYGLKNKNGDVGTIIILGTKEKVEQWKNNLCKWRKELREDKEHFEDKLKIYTEIREKIKDEKNMAEIKRQIETTEKLLETIKSKYNEIEELKIVTIEQNENGEHDIKEVCHILEFIPSWKEI